MPKFLTQEEAFGKCKKLGDLIRIEDIDWAKIGSLLSIAETDFQAAEILKKNLDKNNKEWNSVYKLSYDALHELVECYLRIERIKSQNHQCLFVYL